MPTSVCLEAKRLQRRASTFWITLKKNFGRKIAEPFQLDLFFTDLSLIRSGPRPWRAGVADFVARVGEDTSPIDSFHACLPMQDAHDHPLAHAHGSPSPYASPTDLSARSDFLSPSAPPDPVEVFLGQPVTITRLMEHRVPQNVEGLEMLSADGAWRAVASLAERLLSSSHPVDELLRIRWYRIVALLKTREVGQVCPPAQRSLSCSTWSCARSVRSCGYPCLP